MINKEHEEIVISKLKKMTTKKITPSSDIFNIGIDSLDLVQLITEMESHFNIEVSDIELLEFKTVKDIVEILGKKIK